jgi:hypothetical protein
MKNTERLLRPIRNNGAMKKSFALIMIALMMLAFAGCGTSTVDKNNSAFNDAIKSVNADKIALNDVVPFEWDTLYTFAPYMPKAEIQEIIGFSSDDIKETVSEGMTQLLFIKNDEIVCSICGYGENLGYSFSFGTYEENHLAISWDDDVIFTVNNSNDIVNLAFAD